MCLSPITIKNRKYRFDLHSNPVMFFSVPCGHCAECRKKKANDYMARSYAQYIDTKDAGGWSYFETLTYNNACVPKYKGMLCFNVAHVRNFLKRLRINIERYYLRDYSKPKDKKTNDYPPLLDDNGKKICPYKGKVKGNLKYYCATEYGGKTHRPHIHFIFFVTIDGMNVMLFRDLVSVAWKYGFIDRRYTTMKRVVNGIGACKYLAEYVNKDIEFQKVLDRKINELQISGISVNKHVLKRLKCFHRQSLGFGIGIIRQNKQEILEQGLCQVPDKLYVHKFVSLPMYIKRKLFMECVPYDYKEFGNVYKYDKAGFRHVKEQRLVTRYHWQYTEFGKEWRMSRQNDIIKKVADTYERTFNNFFVYLGENVMKDNSQDVFNYLKDFRENVGFFKLACYTVCYRGRLLSHDADIYEQLEEDMSTVFHDDDIYNVDDVYFKKFRLDCRWKDTMYPFFGLDDKGVYRLVPFCKYDSVPCYFNDSFEKVLNYFSIVQKFQNEALERTYIAKCEYRAKIKLLKKKSA